MGSHGPSLAARVAGLLATLTPVTGDTRSVKNRQEPSSSTAGDGELEASGDPVARLVEALAGACGAPPITGRERAVYRTAAEELARLEVADGDVAEAAAAYRRAWPSMALTPRALVRHWSRFSPRAERDRQVRSAQRLAQQWASLDFESVRGRLQADGQSDQVIAAAETAWLAAQP